MDADFNQFAGSQTANRIVLTVGKFFMTDIFDTNKYANNPKADFLNWSAINNGAFDFGSDAWSDTYGAVAELYLETGRSAADYSTCRKPRPTSAGIAP